MPGLFRTFLIACALTAGATGASAAPFFLSGQYGKANVTYTSSAGNGTASAGAFKFVDQTGLVTGAGQEFAAFCLDLAGRVAAGNTYNYVINTDALPFSVASGGVTLTASQRGNIEQLFNVHYGSLKIANDVQSAAFQVALWEAAYETSGNLSLGSGTFTASSATANVISTAQGYLNALIGPRTHQVTFLEGTVPNVQSMVTAAPIPLPAAAWLLVGAIGAMGALRRRGRAQTA